MMLINRDTTRDLYTLRDFIRYAWTLANRSDLYYGHGTDNPLDDMTSLVLGALNLPLDADETWFNCNLTAEERDLLCQFLDQRINHRIPVPYLIHEARFCDLSFYVDDRVLIPRSPIAELIEQQFFPWIEADRVHRILDMCTGSGCIAIACCYAFPDAYVEAVDLSVDALAVAEINRDNHGLEEQLGLLQSDLFDQLPAATYDLIVSNPPYVGADEMATLPTEYLHEPNMALEAADNGLAIVDRLLRQASDYLTDQGILVVEVGNSEEAVREAYPELPLTWLEFERGGQGVFVIDRQALVDYWSGEQDGR